MAVVEGFFSKRLQMALCTWVFVVFSFRCDNTKEETFWPVACWPKLAYFLANHLIYKIPPLWGPMATVMMMMMRKGPSASSDSRLFQRKLCSRVCFSLLYYQHYRCLIVASWSFHFHKQTHTHTHGVSATLKTQNRPNEARFKHPEPNRTSKGQTKESKRQKQKHR